MIKHEINNIEIQVINPETIDISVGPFRNSEYNRVKITLSMVKQLALIKYLQKFINILTILLIVLEFVNQMLIQSKKPAQWSKCDINNLLFYNYTYYLNYSYFTK